MDVNEKIKKLLDMQEHPEHYSEQTLNTMLKDPEVRELMESTALLKQSMTWAGMSNDSINVEDEWQRFAQQHTVDSKPRHGWIKVAAAFVGVLFVSGITLAAIHFVRLVNSQQVQTSQTEKPIPAKPSVESPTDTVMTGTVMTGPVKTDSIAPKVVCFNEVALLEILTEISEFYNLRVEWRNEEAKTLRLFFKWNQQLKAPEVLEQLNMFEHFHLELNDSTIIAE